jgi:mannose-6-phosphate isomerase-like protein (cupin superfamily)
VPAYARHSMKATEDGGLSYLYIKDRTWTVVGIAADEAPPEEAMSVEEVNRIHATGKWAGQEKAPEKSQAIIGGLGECYYPIIGALDAPAASGNRECWIEGERLAFGFFEYQSGYERPPAQAVHEEFIYVLSGGIDIRVDNENRDAGPGDVVEIPKGSDYGFTVTGEAPLRYAVVRSMPYLEARIDA